jgi:penicillin V acylase-like amidase (Ntn superfamily)
MPGAGPNLSTGSRPTSTNKVYYFNWTPNPNIVWVDLKQIDFSKGSGIRMLNPRLPSAVGDMSSSFEKASLDRSAPLHPAKKK